MSALIAGGGTDGGKSVRGKKTRHATEIKKKMSNTKIRTFYKQVQHRRE